MPEETITFELIRKIQIDEQKSPTLTKIPTNLFNAVTDYIRQKKQLSSEDRKTVLEIKNIENIVQNIFDRRERKILNAAIISARTGLPPENLAEEEKNFYNSIVQIIKTRREDLLKKLLAGKKEEISTVVFKEDVPEFVGANMRTYGPFKKGDSATLPEENIQALLARGVVEEVKS